VIVFKEFRFEAAHWLPNVPPGHKCGRMHGHSYRVRVEVSGPVDATSGMVVDYADIKALFDAKVTSRLDHKVLNDVPGLENSTSENLAQWVFGELSASLSPGVKLRAVEVHETHTAGARVEAT
jgi:6-pyruvoyltetrahydropterin/6-carboxytetrahydropterin synthase